MAEHCCLFKERALLTQCEKEVVSGAAGLHRSKAHVCLRQ